MRRKRKHYELAQLLQNDKMVLSGKEFQKNNKEIKFLGLWISTDPKLYTSLKHEKYKKIKEILGCWKYRRLILLRKINVIKSLVISQ